MWFDSVMGHGSHWRCILPDLERGLGDALEWIPKGTVVGKRTNARLRLPGGDVGAGVILIEWPDTNLRATYIVVRDEKTQKAYLHSAFPSAHGGAMHRVNIAGVTETSCGAEAIVDAHVGDAVVHYFDPRYALNYDEYRVGAESLVDLAGIAYALAIVPPGATMRTQVGNVPLAGAAMLLSASTQDERQAHASNAQDAYGIAHIEQEGANGGSDDYQFCALVRNVEELQIDTIKVWEIHATVTRIHDGTQDVDIPIYATNQALRGNSAPQPGDQISGVLWLQGSPHFNATSPA